MNSAPTIPANGVTPNGASLTQPLPPSSELAQTFPLSFAQQRLWFMEQLQPGSAAYNLPIAWRLHGAVHLAAFEQGVNEIVRRHSALRTTFNSVNGEAVQRIWPFQSFVVSVSDLNSSPEPEADVRRRIDEMVNQPFDLGRGPLFSVKLFRLKADEHVALFNVHHIVWDGWSIEVFRNELTSLYQAFNEGKPSPLPELPIQYADFAVWQRESARDSAWAEQLNYWKEQLKGALPILELPMDRQRSRMQSSRGATEFCEFDDSLTAALRQLSRKSGATLFMTLVAAFKTLLHRYTGQEDILIGSPIAGRPQAEVEGLIGFFVNTLALRTDLSGDPTFAEVLSRVKKVTLGAYANQEMPFDRIVQEIQPERNLAEHTPILSVVIGFESGGVHEWPMGNVRASLLELEAGAPKFDWTLLLEDTESGLKGRLEYNADLFASETIKRLLQHFQILLQGIVTNPQRRISEYPLLTSEEEWLLAEWNQTATDYERDACVHEIFAAQVDKTPDAIALVFGAKQMTYRELNEQADQLARHLRGMDVGPDVLVGLCLERSCELMVAMLAILKAGGAYVPLDRTYPRERLQFMVKDTALTVLVTDSDFDTSDFKSVKHVIRVDGAPSTRSASSESSGVRAERVLGVPKANAENLAYVIYTSGSTGMPKGAAIPHRGIVRLVQNTNYVKFSPKDVFLQLAPVSFDASTFEIWGALLNGAKLVVFPPHVPSLEELGRFIQQHGVTTLWLTAGLFHQMVEHQLGSLKSVRQLLAGGDVLSVTHVTKAARELPDCQIINGYGPTENTTFTTCFRVSADCSGGRSVPIGRPISNTQLFVLDKNLAPVPIGVPGELFIGGDGLARGYLNRPELTAEKFIPSPFNKNQKLYRTGDIVRWLPDGNIEFLGRKDSQVKIRGFRIELGEIETALAQHPAVREAVVIARDTDNSGRQLVAYVVTKGEARFDGAALRKFLEEKLPTYMVPSSFVAIEQMPLTPNGKVDRRALAVLGIKQTAATEAFVAPRNPTETKLAEIWREVLARESIGVHDNFFHLGGHSLLAIQIVSRIGKVFQTELPVRDIFETPTIAGLAEKFQRQPSAPIASRNGIGRRTSRAQAAQLLQQMDKLSDAEVETLLRSSEASKVS